MKFLKVRVFATRIEIVDEISGLENYKKALKSKLPNEQFWKVATFANGRIDIDKHNKIVSLGLRHQDLPTSKKQKTRKKVVSTQKLPAPIPNRITHRQVQAKAATIKRGQLWDWTKVDKALKTKLKKLYKNKKWKDIFVIHNELQLTGEVYCCSSYRQNVITNMEKAVEDGKI